LFSEAGPESPREYVTTIAIDTSSSGLRCVFFTAGNVFVAPITEDGWGSPERLPSLTPAADQWGSPAFSLCTLRSGTALLWAEEVSQNLSETLLSTLWQQPSPMRLAMSPVDMRVAGPAASPPIFQSRPYRRVFDFQARPFGSASLLMWAGVRDSVRGVIDHQLVPFIDYALIPSPGVRARTHPQ